MKVVPTKREIIEERLLTALTEDDKVAIVLNCEELTLLIEALGIASQSPHGTSQDRFDTMEDDLILLRDSAFRRP